MNKVKTGPNQHFIPQSLLRQFRNKASGLARVHVYRRDKSYVSPTSNVASQRHFYSEGTTDDGEPLDSIITRHESGPYNADFNALTASPAGAVDSVLAARIVAHLVGRGDHLRGTIRSGASAMADMMTELFGDSANLARLVGGDGPMPGARFREVMAEHMDPASPLHQLGLPAPVIEALAFMMLRENATEGFSEINAAALGLADRFRSTAPEIARNAQVKALTSSLAPDVRVDQLAGLCWRIVEYDGDATILPDFVVLARDAAGKPSTIYGFDQAELAELIMPLAPSRLLVGQRIDRDPAIGKFNAQAAALCRDFFVSALASPALDALAGTIGRDVDVQLNEGLDDAASEFRKLIDNGSGPNEQTPGWAADFARNFEVETDHLATEDAERLGHILSQLVAHARARFDTDNLRRIVVKGDYAAAIAAVDRGAFDDAIPLVPSSEGVSIAYNVVVERGGEPGIYMVLQPGIGDMLLSKEDLEFGAAAATVLARLAFIGADQLVGTVFADGFAEGEEHDRRLLPRALDAWKDYRVSLYEQTFSNGVGPWYREMLVERLSALGDRLTEVRRRYRVDGELDRFVADIVEIAGSVMSAAAKAAASLIGEEDQAFRAELEAIGWVRWFALFERDLAEIWAEGSSYPGQSDFLVLARHMQRLFVAGAIFVWDAGDGRMKVEVPYFSDIGWMLEQAASAQAAASEAQPESDQPPSG